MPRANDGSIFLELTRPQRSSHVRAEVVDGVILAPAIEDGDQLLADGESPPLPFPNGSHFGDGNEFGHVGGISQKFLGRNIQNIVETYAVLARSEYVSG